MIHDQADELRQLVRQRCADSAVAQAPLVVVTGGKGGVGATTLAANLAVALARQGRRAVFVDADLDHGGNTHLSAHSDRGSVLDVLAGRRNVHEVLERGPSGIQVLSGAWASGDSTEYSAAAQERFITELARLAPHAEVVVVDAGSGRGPFVRRLWEAAGAVVVVMTIEDNAILQCYAAIKVLSGDAPQPIYTLVDRAPDAAAAADAHARVAEACRRFLGQKAVAAGCVPQCDAHDQPVLIFPPRGEAARATDRVADRLWAQLQLRQAREPSSRRQAAVST
jgi:MinD-like ATPase involved in chromosome partitioning or flagellar assembly